MGHALEVARAELEGKSAMTHVRKTLKRITFLYQAHEGRR